MIGTVQTTRTRLCAQTKKAKALGADYALVITPYYIKPTQNGMYEYYSAIARAVDIPIVIYNVPGRTGINISAATVVKLANEHPVIVGVKEASGNLVQVTEIIRDAPPSFV